MIAMSTLICIIYEDVHRAAEVFPSLLRLRASGLVDIDDTISVMRDRDGMVHMHRLTQIPDDAVAGAFWQTLLHALLIVPLADRAEDDVDASALLETRGIAADFAAHLRSHLRPGTSAILILIRRPIPAWGIPEVSRFGGAILMTHLRLETGEP
jgi:uncharacterized membrane protein